MMIQIRNNVFETNSSSSHSLVVMKESGKYTQEEIEKDMWINSDGIWRIYDTYFGRSPFDILCTFESKWRYALASMCKLYNDDIYKELTRILKKYCPQVTEINLDTATDIKKMKTSSQNEGLTKEEMEIFLDALEKQFGKSICFWDDGCGYWEYEVPDVGAVDEDILSGFLKRNNISLEDFITERKYAVIVDGDEYCIWDKLKESQLIDKAKIVEEEK